MPNIEEASPICRGKNLTWETVLLFYNNMPKKPMPKSDFHSYIEGRINGWTQTHSQIARQLAFYYEKDGYCYPRFTGNDSMANLISYMQNWATKYFVPNPYAPSLKGFRPTCIYDYIKNSIYNNETNFDDVLDSIFDVKLSSHDKVKVYLNNFTDIIIDSNHLMCVNQDIKLSVNNYTQPTDETANDYELYFNYFGSSIKRDSNTSSSTQSLLSYLTAIRTKPFILLAGISGTGKSRIVRKLAQATDTIGQYADDAARFACHKPGNFCLIQVKPNWHNSMDVVGYKSNIGKNGEHYEYTDFIDFIAKAWQHPDVPFFLCLDEMNLAPVEEYFAEFLSAIESRSIDADGNYETDPIVRPFKEFGDDVCKQMIAHLLGTKPDSDLAERFRNKGLTLPKNLIVMGTVNMDETTFSFSRKVLDRAMSIEMNEVDYDAFLEGSTEMDVPVLVADNQLLIDRAIKAQDVKDNIDAEAVKDFLNSVNNVLEGTPFKLGYRAANEAMLYVSAAKDFGNDNLVAALDEFTLMKILSRIEGDDSKLRTMLGENLLDELQKLFLEGPLGTLSSSKTLAKLDQMIKSLERDHFVSFWG